MRRDLPPHPSLDHLKKQAKDLLDAHRRAEPEALARIRDAVPSHAGMTDEELASAPFALHDAQSAIAREYGLKSWNELRDEVASRLAGRPLPEELLKALMRIPLPDAVRAAMTAAWSRRGEAIAAAKLALPGSLPLVALRDALLAPQALAPIHVARAMSLAAIDAAMARTPPTLAVFSQRTAEREDVDTASLYPVGYEALVHARIPEGDRAWVVLEGVRWIALDGLEGSPASHLTARVKPVQIEPGDPAEVATLAEGLRARARPLASALPSGERLVTMIDELEPGPLADLVVANLPVALAEKARYASEPKLTDRLRIATALTDAAAAAGGATR
jgi:hypothetical protein